MVKEIPKDTQLALLIELIECKIKISEFWAREDENKYKKANCMGEISAYRDILKVLRSLLPVVEIS